MANKTSLALSLEMALERLHRLHGLRIYCKDTVKALPSL